MGLWSSYRGEERGNVVKTAPKIKTCGEVTGQRGRGKDKRTIDSHFVCGQTDTKIQRYKVNLKMRLDMNLPRAAETDASDTSTRELKMFQLE